VLFFTKVGTHTIKAEQASVCWFVAVAFLWKCKSDQTRYLLFVGLYKEIEVSSESEHLFKHIYQTVLM
jgi:hypothetical protein